MDLCGKIKTKPEDSTDMEYLSILNVLLHIDENSKVILYNDNQSVINSINDNNNNKNVREIKSLVKSKKLDVKFKWVPREYNNAGIVLG